MTEGQEPALDFIVKYWELIVTAIILLVGYVELRFKVRSHGEKIAKSETRIDTIEVRLREDLHEIRDDIKTLLSRGA